MNQATKVTAATMGVLVGLAGIEHGIFEMLQGSQRPEDLMIAAIGPMQRFWLYGEETALTLIPNFLVTGILAVVLGVLVTTWSIKYMDKKFGALILFLSGLALFLVGGGFAPIFMTVIASLTAGRISSSLKFWRTILPKPLQWFFGRIWPGVLVAFVVIFVFSVVVAIFGWPLTRFLSADATSSYLGMLSYIMLAFMLFSPVTAFSHDIQATREVARPREQVQT